MDYQDTYILESDAPGLIGDDFEVVALAGGDNEVGLLVANSFGLTTDMASLNLDRPVARLLVSVSNPQEAATAERVRRALRWEARAPF